MDKVSYVGNADVSAIDHLYKMYLQDNESVDLGWQKFFEGFDFAQTNYEEGGAVPENYQKEFKVISLIDGYRNRGHLFTKTNPVRDRRTYSPTLDIENFGLEQGDLDTIFQAGEQVGIGAASLREIIAHLEATYCGSIGIEFMYMREPAQIEWFRKAIELKNRPKYDAARKLEIYKKLNQATNFESFLGKKFVGQKRFSIEGLEALVPALDALMYKGITLDVEHFIVGMAHRGRLNTLTNIFEKRPKDIFSEFEGKEFDIEARFDGDVKYHQGFTSHITTKNGKKVGLTLSPNPSHLEAVDPVVQGICRAKIDHFHKDESKVCPVMIHGDAAVAGQGIVYEVVQMAQLDGYRVGGTVHIVTNNQVGFTTNYLDARSSTYCTDVAKTTLCPVFHVNADDVEAVITTMQWALEYREKYNMDVFVDLLGYRKYGHNEGDEPKFTQPTLYKQIASHLSLRELYLKQLTAEGNITNEEAETVRINFETHLDASLEKAKSKTSAFVKHFLEETWKDVRFSTPEDFDSTPCVLCGAGIELRRTGRNIRKHQCSGQSGLYRYADCWSRTGRFTTRKYCRCCHNGARARVSR